MNIPFTASPPRDALFQSLRLYRLTVEQYHGMIRAGVLTENDRCELLEGWLVAKMTHNPPHDCAITLAQAQLLPHLGSIWMLRVQSAVTTRDSEPEPDVAVVRGPARRHVRAHPAPKDIGLLVEIAESTPVYDRREKCRLYARARVPVYWIVNLVDGMIEVYTQPRAGRNPGYRERRDYGNGEGVPLVLDGREIAQIPVDDLLP